jgi:hypothetical protein
MAMDYVRSFKPACAEASDFVEFVARHCIRYGCINMSKNSIAYTFADEKKPDLFPDQSADKRNNPIFQ